MLLTFQVFNDGLSVKITSGQSTLIWPSVILDMVPRFKAFAGYVSRFTFQFTPLSLGSVVHAEVTAATVMRREVRQDRQHKQSVCF